MNPISTCIYVHNKSFRNVTNHEKQRQVETRDVIHIVPDVKTNGTLFKKRDMKNYKI